METRTTVHRVLRVLTMSFTLVVATATTGPMAASAAAPNSVLCLAPASASMKSQAKNEELNLATAKMRQAGKSEVEIDQFMKSHFNLVRLTPRSKPNEIVVNGVSSLTVPAPGIYRDTCTGVYTVIANWQFTSLSGIDDGHPAGCVGTCDVAGEDGFGMALSRVVSSVNSYSVTTCGNTTAFPCSGSRMHVEEGGVDGAGFAGIDKINYSGTCCRHDYSFWWGQLVYGIGSVGCGTLQAFSRYGHDWNSTTVSVSVGVPMSVGLSFSSSSSRWQLGSQPSNTVTPC